MTPMTPEEAAKLCRRLKVGTYSPLKRDWEYVAPLIEAQAAEIATQAALMAQMREALEMWHNGWGTGLFTAASKVARNYREELHNKTDAALAATPTEAEQQVREWQEKAALLDWLMTQPMNANLAAIKGKDYVEFVIRVKELYGPWTYEEREWTDEQLLDALRAAKEAENA